MKKYNPLALANLLKKLLPHGMPELSKVHEAILKHFRPDGYIPVEKLVFIINRNDSIGKHVKSKMFGNTITHIKQSDILNAISLPEVITWFKICMINNVLMIRSNFDHTLDIVDCKLLADEQITKAKENFKIYLRLHKNEANKHLDDDTFVDHKSFKFWSSAHPHTLYYDEFDSDWINICLNVQEALDQGFILYMVEGRVIITRSPLPENCKIYFKIPKELFFIENYNIKEI